MNTYRCVPRVAPVMRTVCPDSEKSWGDGRLGVALIVGVKAKCRFSHLEGPLFVRSSRRRRNNNILGWKLDGKSIEKETVRPDKIKGLDLLTPRGSCRTSEGERTATARATRAKQYKYRKGDER